MTDLGVSIRSLGIFRPNFSSCRFLLDIDGNEVFMDLVKGGELFINYIIHSGDREDRREHLEGPGETRWDYQVIIKLKDVKNIKKSIDKETPTTFTAELEITLNEYLDDEWDPFKVYTVNLKHSETHVIEELKN